MSSVWRRIWWKSLNSEGFQYSEDYLKMDNWDQAQPRDDSFVRNYSVISEKKDRATVIEAVFRYDDEWWKKHPLIQKKLDVLLAAAEPIFGMVYFHK